MFKDKEALYKNYRNVPKFAFEMRTYEFIKEESFKDMVVHIYRCESEQHNIRIYLNEGAVFNIEFQYSIN